jgi:hypothetical protein
MSITTLQELVMGRNTNPDHHNGHDGKPLRAEAIQALLASQSEQSAKPADHAEVTAQPLLKQPPWYGETPDSIIASLIEDLPGNIA